MADDTGSSKPYSPSEAVIFTDHAGVTHDAVVIKSIGVITPEAGQSVYIRTADGRTVYTNEHALARPDASDEDLWMKAMR
jgi:hypothetical protein